MYRVVHNLLAHLTLCFQVVYDLLAGLPAIEVDLVSAHVEKVHRSEGVHEVLVQLTQHERNVRIDRVELTAGRLYAVVLPRLLKRQRGRHFLSLSSDQMAI
jgi:hypothetical protein